MRNQHSIQLYDFFFNFSIMRFVRFMSHVSYYEITFDISLGVNFYSSRAKNSVELNIQVYLLLRAHKMNRYFCISLQADHDLTSFISIVGLSTAGRSTSLREY